MKRLLERKITRIIWYPRFTNTPLHCYKQGENDVFRLNLRTEAIEWWCPKERGGLINYPNLSHHQRFLRRYFNKCKSSHERSHNESHYYSSLEAETKKLEWKSRLVYIVRLCLRKKKKQHQGTWCCTSCY